MPAGLSYLWHPAPRRRWYPMRSIILAALLALPTVASAQSLEDTHVYAYEQCGAIVGMLVVSPEGLPSKALVPRTPKAQAQARAMVETADAYVVELPDGGECQTT